MAALINVVTGNTIIMSNDENSIGKDDSNDIVILSNVSK